MKGYTLEHLPGNPQGKYLNNFTMNLLTEDDQCLQGVSLARPKGNDFRDLVSLTEVGMKLRDDLLVIPGVIELSFYQNWYERGRNVFIEFSESVEWSEVWHFIEAYLDLRLAGADEVTVAELLKAAKTSLATPLLAVERCPNDEYFVLHTRTPIFGGSYMDFGAEYFASPEELSKLFAPLNVEILQMLASQEKVIGLSVQSHKLSFSVNAEDRERVIALVVPLMKEAFYPGVECQIREVYWPPVRQKPDFDDDWMDTDLYRGDGPSESLDGFEGVPTQDFCRNGLWVEDDIGMLDFEPGELEEIQGQSSSQRVRLRVGRGRRT